MRNLKTLPAHRDTGFENRVNRFVGLRIGQNAHETPAKRPRNPAKPPRNAATPCEISAKPCETAVNPLRRCETSWLRVGITLFVYDRFHTHSFIAFGAPHPLGRRTTSRRAVPFRITVCESSFALRPHQWQCIVLIATPTHPPRRDRHGPWQPNGTCITCILLASLSQAIAFESCATPSLTAPGTQPLFTHGACITAFLSQVWHNDYDYIYGSAASALDARAGLRHADARCSCSPPVRDPPRCARVSRSCATAPRARQAQRLLGAQ